MATLGHAPRARPPCFISSPSPPPRRHTPLRRGAVGEGVWLLPPTHPFHPLPSCYFTPGGLRLPPPAAERGGERGGGRDPPPLCPAPLGRPPSPSLRAAGGAGAPPPARPSLRPSVRPHRDSAHSPAPRVGAGSPVATPSLLGRPRRAGAEGHGGPQCPEPPVPPRRVDVAFPQSQVCGSSRGAEPALPFCWLAFRKAPVCSAMSRLSYRSRAGYSCSVGFCRGALEIQWRLVPGRFTLLNPW